MSIRKSETEQTGGKATSNGDTEYAQTVRSRTMTRRGTMPNPLDNPISWPRTSGRMHTLMAVKSARSPNLAARMISSNGKGQQPKSLMGFRPHESQRGSFVDETKRHSLPIGVFKGVVGGGFGLRRDMKIVGHLDAVRSVDLRFDPYGRTELLTGSDDGLVALWNLDNISSILDSNPDTDMALLPRRNLRGHMGPVTSVVFETGHPWAYSAGMDIGIRVWSLAQPEADNSGPLPPHHVFMGHSDVAWDLALSQDTEWLASASSDGTCAIWDVARFKARPVSRLGYQQGALEFASQPIPTSVCFAPNESDKAAIAYDVGVAQLFDIERKVAMVTWVPKRSEGRQPGLFSKLNRIVGTKGGRSVMFAGGEDGQVYLVDRRASEIVYSWHSHQQPITAMDVHSTGQYLVTGSTDSYIRWWDLRTARSYKEDTVNVTKGGESVCSVRFGVSSSFLSMTTGGGGPDQPAATESLPAGVAVGCADGTARIYK
ncbi:1,2-dihydroxy-3-keto-5-methylthiopentene dioxygenase [Spiromyces aspiralis]|uniref:1,2-dihydroxy-3-keto-5-methylthiopentene dioxygenase n=1 Tax=Spiromyces aspiralis TaxID=68401 RepID=A0ACC1HWY6_9FUNG|nr:1,2-dihydroxy-3-keto-5-methylthiopentene dioxygenase [Spiromyces aspiralis]